MDIKSVIQRHGFQLQEVSVKMKVKHSTLSGMLSGNPTIGTLRKIVDAINAMNDEKQLADRCYLAEFFADELPEDFTLTSSAQPAPQPADKMGSAHEVSTEGKQSPDELPWERKMTVAEELQVVEDEPVLTADVALICPHCHEAIKMGFIK